ncbi:MAG TPA: hypothetical protein VMB77_00345 [Syntrophales bacterium]|nr:hypothetical protein [Syntrophales bacterium]
MDPPTPIDTSAQAKADHEEAARLIRAGRNEEALPLLARALAVLPEDRHIQADYALCLSWTGAYQRAVEFYGPREATLKQLTYVPRNMAKAYYELRDYPKAMELYRLGLSYDPGDGESFKGVIFTSMRMGDAAGAYAAMKEAEKGGRIPARTLDEMKVLLLEQYGAPSEALGVAEKTKVGAPAQIGALRAGTASEKITWGEWEEAIAELRPILTADPGNFAARADLIAALRQTDRMGEVLQQFEILKTSGKPIPWWITESVADAYLYLKEPEIALRYYRMSMEQGTDNAIGALLGIVSCHTALRQWDKGWEVFDEIDGVLAKRKRSLEWDESILSQKSYVADLNRVIVAKGWFLLSQDRLKEGQEYFEHYLSEAASDTGLRGGLAHDYLWRYWPRRALEQFEISRDMDPEDKKLKTGLAAALNELNYKQQARQISDELTRRYPRDYFVNELRESLQVEQMWHVQPEFFFTKEYTGGTEYMVSLLLEKPLTPTFSLNTAILRQEAWEDTDTGTNRAVWDRVGLGFRWIVTPELIWQQSLSFDFISGGDFGSNTRLTWWPTDPLHVSVLYDSFSMSVPLRARVQGINAQQAGVDLLYRSSELRDYGLSAGQYWFSDSNNHPYGAAYFNQTVYSTPDLKVRAGLVGSVDGYSRQDVVYYSPEYEWSILATSAIQWVNFQRYERGWTSALYLRAGVSGEKNYSVYPVGGVTLEEVYVHSRTFNVRGSASYDLRVYDGNYTNVIGLYLTLNWYF